ncbi:hypothetical protein EVAR_24522_1 [Eumeta japonica]|uniref:Uncharacterized protein n=1 Tax=Eumeta variegata TaxID=151549 RepID=A0A4C1US87_EUMVA|nr:hypothetical protein EVAR_24522_1 [Eumeta japonica]
MGRAGVASEDRFAWADGGARAEPAAVIYRHDISLCSKKLRIGPDIRVYFGVRVAFATRDLMRELSGYELSNQNLPGSILTKKE